VATIFAIGNLGIVGFVRGTPEGAIPLLEQALALARSVRSTRWIAITQAIIGLNRLVLGEVEQAQADLIEAIYLLRQLDDRVFMVYALIGCAGVAAVRSQPQRAAKLLGAAEGLRLLISADIPHVLVAQIDPIIAATRAQIEAKTFAALWAEGQAMALSRAGDYAMHAPPEPVG